MELCVPLYGSTHPYLRERGLTEAAIRYFGLGFASRGVMKERIAIPIHNEQGELVAYAGRWPGETPEGQERYLLPPDFHKSVELFNIHRVELAGRGTRIPIHSKVRKVTL